MLSPPNRAHSFLPPKGERSGSESKRMPVPGTAVFPFDSLTSVSFAAVLAEVRGFRTTPSGEGLTAAAGSFLADSFFSTFSTFSESRFSSRRCFLACHPAARARPSLVSPLRGGAAGGSTSIFDSAGFNACSAFSVASSSFARGVAAGSSAF